MHRRKNMRNFVFYNPVKLIFGKNTIRYLSDEIPKNKRILMTYGGGSIKKNQVYTQVKSALHGHTLFEFGGIEPNPAYETLSNALGMIEEYDIDFLLAVGGGSVIDGTKFLACAACYKKGDPWDIVAKGIKVKKALPLGTVLTLPATGSEMNCGAVITRLSTKDKLPFSNPVVYPKFSILDPETTYSLPPHQTSNGIIDTFVHVLEQYLTYPVNAPLQDRFSESLLLTLIEEAPKVIRNPLDYEARANIMLCSSMALNGLIAMGVPEDWATHLIGHELTVKFGIDHGKTLAILMPSLMDIQRKQKQEKLLQYAKRVWNIPEGPAHIQIDKAIQKTRLFFESLGVSTRLRDYQITEKDFPSIVALLKKHGLIALGEHQDITLETSLKILKNAI